MINKFFSDERSNGIMFSLQTENIDSRYFDFPNCENLATSPFTLATNEDTVILTCKHQVEFNLLWLLFVPQ